MRTLQIKMGSTFFDLTLTTKRKTCIDCNGRTWIYTDEGKDGCSECGCSGDLIAQLIGVLEDDGNEFYFKDILNRDDFQKLDLAKQCFHEKERNYVMNDMELDAIRPKVFYKGKEVRNARQFTS